MILHLCVIAFFKSPHFSIKLVYNYIEFGDYLLE